MTEQDLQAIRAILQEELKKELKAELQPINKRLDTMDQRLDTIDQRLDTVDQRLDRLEESQEEVRDAVNALLEWSDKVSETYRFPLPRI